MDSVLFTEQGFVHPVYMCFVDLQKAYDPIPQGILQGHRIPRLLQQAIQFDFHGQNLEA